MSENCPKFGENWDGHCKNAALPDHCCPYAQEINDDDSFCNCCEDCIEECKQDI